MIEAFDFLPSDFNPYLKIFIYVLILVHVLAFGLWCVLACPSILKKQDTFSDKVDKMFAQNK